MPGRPNQDRATTARSPPPAAARRRPRRADTTAARAPAPAAASSSCSTRWQTPLRSCTRGPPSAGRVDLLAEGLAHDARTGQEHRRVVGHQDQVGERGRVRAAAGRGAGDDRDLRHDAARARPSPGRSGRSRRAPRCPPASGRRRTRRTRRPGSRPGRPSGARGRSCRRAARRASRRGSRRPGRSTRSARPSTAPVAPTTPSPATARAPRRPETTRVRISWRLPGSHSASSRSSGDSRPVAARCAVALTRASGPRKTSATLWPPNANEFEMATGGRPLPSTSGRASPGT